MKRFTIAIILITLLITLFFPSPSLAAAQTTHIDPGVPSEVIAQWINLAAQYPTVAARIQRIEVRRHVWWTISYEQRIVYLNGDKGSYALNFALTREFAYRAYDYVRLWRPADLKKLTRYQFTAQMLIRVR